MTTVGWGVGGPVGEAVGNTVGVLVGDTVGSSVGVLVGDTVGESVVTSGPIILTLNSATLSAGAGSLNGIVSMFSD